MLKHSLITPLSGLKTVSYCLGHADISPPVDLEIDIEMKRRIIEKLDAPVINDQAPWHKPGIIEWLNTLGKKSGLCEVNPGRLKQHQRLEVDCFT